jgi:hypothetical protein
MRRGRRAVVSNNVNCNNVCASPAVSVGNVRWCATQGALKSNRKDTRALSLRRRYWQDVEHQRKLLTRIGQSLGVNEVTHLLLRNRLFIRL